MMKWQLIAVLALAIPLIAQPRFEVASVRPVATMRVADEENPSLAAYRAGKAGSFCMFCISGNHYDYYGANLKVLIAQAWRIDPRLVVGPEWLNRQDSGLFVIHATMPEGSSRDQIPEMLQSLLKDRFHLTVHRGTGEQTLYALTLGKNGARLKPARELNRAACSPWFPSGFAQPNGAKAETCRMITEEGDRTVTTTMNSDSAIGPSLSSMSRGETFEIHSEYFRITMSQLASRLTDSLSIGSPLMATAGTVVKVVDKTGIEGAWDVVFDQSPGGMALPTISGSLERQGLHLERSTAPVETLVIDQLDKIPTAN